jgi:hypothetical protein
MYVLSVETSVVARFACFVVLHLRDFGFCDLDANSYSFGGINI